MTIEEYLAALRGRLRAQPLRRRRVLAEVEDHLRQSAARHGEPEAIRRFGPPEDVARRFAPDWAPRAVAVALAGFVAAYLAAENLLPPAPWPSADAAPALIRWTTAGATWAFAAAVVLFVLRRMRLAGLAAAAASLLALASGLDRAIRYEALGVPGRLAWWEVALGAAWLAGLAVASLVWATAQRASRS